MQNSIKEQRIRQIRMSPRMVPLSHRQPTLHIPINSNIPSILLDLEQPGTDIRSDDEFDAFHLGLDECDLEVLVVGWEGVGAQDVDGGGLFFYVVEEGS